MKDCWEAKTFMVNKEIVEPQELVAPCPTSKLEDHPLSAVHDYLFNIFAATFHI
jgi:hypothetical protein